jgi:DNA-binding transcriptional regulator YiaG
MDRTTMRKFDAMCLTPVRPLKPKDIRALRLREGASQAVFARYLNVKPLRGLGFRDDGQDVDGLVG